MMERQSPEVPMDRVEPCMDIARRTGKFKPEELDVLEEVLRDCQENPGRDYHFLDETAPDGRMSGFIIIGRTPMSRYGWDIYWIAVDPGVQRRGLGAVLLEKAQRFVLDGKEPKVIFRVETAGKDEYVATRNFYLKNGFAVSGIIADFYDEGDDLVIFSRTAVR